MRIESVNFSNIAQAFPCMAQFKTIAGADIDLERSIQWIMKSMHEGFRGKIAFDGMKPIGNTFYGPLKRSITPVEANVDVIHLRCLYIDPEKRGAGIGQSLVAAMKADCGNYAGVVVRATDTKSYMHHSYFEGFGFRPIKEQGGIHYMFLPIKSDSVKLKIKPPKYKPIGPKIEVTLFRDDFCPFWNHISDGIRGIVGSFGESVNLREIELTPNRARQYGTAATCLIDGENAFPGDVKDEVIKTRIADAITTRLARKEGWDPRSISVNK